MYLDYFGFSEQPFSIAPDPRFLYMSDRHREAFAHLLYGIEHEGGFVLLTGEVGTGKTTVCRCLLDKIPADTNLAFVLNPKVTVPELLATICDEFGIAYPDGNTSNKVFIDRINEFLLRSNAEGRRSVLIIDEAQNLDTEVLEQVRLLTNLETNQRKLLQIIVLGQPELQDKLARPELRQLAQRITARYHLGPLGQGEMAAYVTHRLRVAGVKGKDPLFSSACYPQLFRLTNGIPRLINLLCDRALLGAYGAGAMQVDRVILRQAAREVLGQGAGEAWRVAGLQRRRTRLAVTGAVVTIAVALAIGIKSGWLPGVWHTGKATDGGAANTETAGETALPRTPEKSGSAVNTADAMVARLAAEPAYEHAASPAPAPEWQGGPPPGLPKARAFESLFRLWDIAYNPERDADPCTFAREQGLRCVQRQDSLETLRRFNRPAVLRLASDTGGESAAALVSFDGGRAMFASGTETWSLDQRELARYWSGSYTLLWRPPAGYEDSVRPGHRGPVVGYIADLLARVQGRPPAPPATEYGNGLVMQVKEFQHSEGLVPDGIVGVQTLILLQARAGSEAPFLVPAPAQRG